METAYSTLLSRPVENNQSDISGAVSRAADITRALSLDEKSHPRIITMGGDHTIVLPILRSLHKTYGPISVIHFDAHLDTWSSESSSYRK
jgi:agmatinase